MAAYCYGVKHWVKIAAHIVGRTDVKCRERWSNVLNPGVSDRAWTNEVVLLHILYFKKTQEDKQLLKVADTLDRKWAAVAKTFQGRTDNQVCLIKTCV